MSRLSFAAICCLLILHESWTQADEPKPEALIQGLLNSRSAIIRGHLEAVIEIALPKRNQPDPDVRLSVFFDGDDWFFDQSNETHLDEAPNIKKLRANQKKVEGLAVDRQRAVELRIGEWRRLHFGIIRKPGEIHYYDPTFGANLVKPDQGMDRGIFVFDPRALGLDQYLHFGYEVNEYLDFLVKLNNIKNLTLDSDTLGGDSCWRVRNDANGIVRTLWIQDINSFRLLKCLNETPYETESVISSYDSADQVLPTMVTIQRANTKGTILSKMVLRVVKSALGQTVPQDTFTLKKLGMPVGQFMADRRNGRLKSLGYWDGEKLVPQLPVEAIRRERASEPPRGNAYTPLIYASVLFLGVAGAYYLARRRGQVRDLA